MDIGKNLLNTMAEETGISVEHVSIYYDILSRIPCVYYGEKYQFLNCLYTLINSRKLHPCDFDSDDFNYLLSDALFKTYKEKSIPYLNLYYMGTNAENMGAYARLFKKQKPQ